MRAHYRNVVQDTAGNISPGASIAVYQPGTTTVISATMYADGSSGTTLANPYTSPDGTVNFYLAASQRVDIGVTPAGGSQLLFHDIDVEAPVGQLSPSQVTIAGTTGATSSPLSVIGSSAAGQLVYIEQDSSTDHALTVSLVGTGGATQAALNVVSANSAFSAAEISGTELSHGTLKITHKGYQAASDSGAAALSIDLQTTVGGSTGTAAQGVFITSTTDAIPGGNAVTVRYNSQDWFVVKGNVGAGNGIVGIGVATGHTPAGMLEIAQKDTTTFGLAMQALASGTDMINLKDSGGNQRFQVNNAGNLITRANALLSTTVQIGSTSANLGGGGSGCVGITPTGTIPSTNPSGFGVVLYVDAAGNLSARTSAGNVRIVAAV